MWDQGVWKGEQTFFLRKKEGLVWKGLSSFQVLQASNMKEKSSEASKGEAGIV